MRLGLAHQHAHRGHQHSSVIGQADAPVAWLNVCGIMPADSDRTALHSRLAFISRPSQRSTAATSSADRGRATVAISDANCAASLAVSLIGCLLMAVFLAGPHGPAVVDCNVVIGEQAVAVLIGDDADPLLPVLDACHRTAI